MLSVIMLIGNILVRLSVVVPQIQLSLAQGVNDDEREKEFVPSLKAYLHVRF